MDQNKQESVSNQRMKPPLLLEKSVTTDAICLDFGGGCVFLSLVAQAHPCSFCQGPNTDVMTIVSEYGVASQAASRLSERNLGGRQWYCRRWKK